MIARVADDARGAAWFARATGWMVLLHDVTFHMRSIPTDQVTKL
jgi:hypothetical protein